ncbi:hypothetical protein [Thalassobacillus sp. C254]|uniref:hypothetical protein n=1 Tax=Thalassobacillus sp. C254 TaxID=1225341 RepID=UPI0006D16985|nr:hypothetical protein [Thalassobacillus sp. C254]
MYQYVPYRSSSESQRYFPVLPFLAGLAVSPLIFGGYGGGYGGYAHPMDQFMVLITVLHSAHPMDRSLARYMVATGQVHFINKGRSRSC